MTFVNIMQAAIASITAFFTYTLVVDLKKNKDKISNASTVKLSLIGIITMFGDTLGIGSYAPQTAAWKFFKLVPDRLIPGTLNTASIIPASITAILFITVIEVEPITLISLIVAATIGAYIGAGFVSKLPEKKIQIGMGIALIIVALIMLAGMFDLMPSGGTAIGLSGWKLILAVVVFFILGALMTIGIGCYAPMMAMVFALGMSPRVVFPIMLGSCAFLMPAAGIKFIKEDSYDRKATLTMNIASIFGVLIAVYIVKTIPLTALKWLVLVIIIYTSITMLRSAFKNKKPTSCCRPPQ